MWVHQTSPRVVSQLLMALSPCRVMVGTLSGLGAGIDAGRCQFLDLHVTFPRRQHRSTVPVLRHNAHTSPERSSLTGPPARTSARASRARVPAASASTLR